MKRPSQLNASDLSRSCPKAGKRRLRQDRPDLGVAERLAGMRLGNPRPRAVGAAPRFPPLVYLAPLWQNGYRVAIDGYRAPGVMGAPAALRTIEEVRTCRQQWGTCHRSGSK